MRRTLLGRIMIVVVPVLILNAAVLVAVLHGRTRAQFIVYLSSQEQLEAYQPRERVLIDFYAERIAGVMPVATEGSISDLVDRLSQTLGRGVVVARNDDFYAPSSSLRGAEGSYRVQSDGRLFARIEQEDGGITEVVINPLITERVTPFTREASGEDVVRIYMLPDLDSPVGPREERFMSSTSRTIVFSVSSVAVLLMGLLAFVVAQSLKPVRRLTSASNAAVDGAIPEPVEVSGTSELRELAQAFNEVGLRLRATEAARKRLMSDVSHELRGPIGNLQAQIEAMQDGLLHCDRETLASLHEDVSLVARLIDDLHEVALADAKALSLHLEKIDLAEMVESAAHAYRLAFAEKDVALEIAVDNNPVVTVDRQRMHQALGNILSNALRYTEPGGNVTIRTFSDSGTHPASAVIEVEDSGSGVTTAELETIFERFYRSDESRARSSGGSGLGLAVTRAIVTSHNGTIRAQMAQPRGLRVIIELPMPDA